MLQSCDVRIVKSLNTSARHQYFNWASEQLSDIARSNALPAPNRHVVSGWTTSAFESLPNDCIREKFQHTGFTSDGVSASSTPYTSTSFPYIQQSHIDDDQGEDNFDLHSEEWDWDVNFLALFLCLRYQI